MFTSEDKDTIIRAFNILRNEAYTNACKKGFWDKRHKLLEAAKIAGLYDEMIGMIESQMIALTHSELSEGLEGMRKNLQDDHLPERKMIECEFADAIIRLCDHAEFCDYDIGGAIIDKMNYNSGRPHMHGGKSF